MEGETNENKKIVKYNIMIIIILLLFSISNIFYLFAIKHDSVIKDWTKERRDQNRDSMKTEYYD